MTADGLEYAYGVRHRPYAIRHRRPAI